MFGNSNAYLSDDARDEQLKEAMRNGAILIDVRSVSDFNAGSISKAINVPVDRISHYANKWNKTDYFILFCGSGNRSAQAKHLLAQKGFKNVAIGGTYAELQVLFEKGYGN